MYKMWISGTGVGGVGGSVIFVFRVSLVAMGDADIVGGRKELEQL